MQRNFTEFRGCTISEHYLKHVYDRFHLGGRRCKESYMARIRRISTACASMRGIQPADLVADAFREDLEIVAGVLTEECSKFYYKLGVLKTARYVRDLANSQSFYERALVLGARG